MGLDRVALEHVTRILNADLPERQKLEQTLRALAKWRSQLIGSTLVARSGTTIQDGPFKGMTYVASTSEGGIAPKLLGVYESVLHDVFADAPRRHYDAVLNVGCAEGYYAIGCARLLPNVDVLAWDIDPVARRKCLELARLNGVEARIDLRERFEAGHAGCVRDELSNSSDASREGCSSWIARVRSSICSIRGGRFPLARSRGRGSSCAEPDRRRPRAALREHACRRGAAGENRHAKSAGMAGKARPPRPASRGLGVESRPHRISAS